MADTFVSRVSGVQRTERGRIGNNSRFGDGRKEEIRVGKRSTKLKWSARWIYERKGEGGSPPSFRGSMRQNNPLAHRLREKRECGGSRLAGQKEMERIHFDRRREDSKTVAVLGYFHYMKPLERTRLLCLD